MSGLPIHSDDLENDSLLRVKVTAKFVLRDEMRVDMFLNRKQRELAGKRPIDLAQTKTGAAHVERLLWAIHADNRL